MPIQQIDRMAFGVARIFVTPPGTTQRLPVTNCHDVEVDLKIDLKEAYAEGGFAIAVADGHRSIDITGKHYSLDLNNLAYDFNAALPVLATVGTAIDEAGVIAAGHTLALTHAATFIPGTALVTVYIVVGGVQYPVRFAIVTAGTEVAGVSCSITAGVITFAAGEVVGSAVIVTYDYTFGAATGSTILLTNTYQNSSSPYSMTLLKRDRSPIDGSVGILKADIFAVRPGGAKLPFKENEWSSYDRTWKAFADPTGNVMRLSFFNV